MPPLPRLSARFRGFIRPATGPSSSGYRWITRAQVIVPSIGISGITFYTGQRFAGWMGDLFVSGLSGKQIQRVLLTEAGVYGREVLLHELAKRIRDLRQGPDELLYVVTDGDEDGEVLRIEPDDPPTTETTVSAEGTSFWKRWFSRPRRL